MSINIRKLSNLLGTATMAACISLLPMQSTAQEQFTLRWASFVSPMAITNKETIPAFIKAVEEASEGTLKIDFFPGGTLGSSPAQQLSMVENGVADIAEVVPSYTPGRFAELSVFELPYLAETNVEGSSAAWKMYEADMLSGFDDLMLVGIMLSGPYGLAANKPLATLDDLKGLRLRAAGPTQSAIVSALGAVPIGNLAASAIAENISRGLLDGTLTAPSLLKAFRIPDAAHSHNWDAKFGSVAVIFPMRRDTFAKMPQKAQDALTQFSGATLSRQLGEALDSDEVRVKQEMRDDKDQTVYEWTPEEIAQVREMLAPLRADWDKPNAAGINLYAEAVKAIDEVRAGN
jgi:TRAP-type C4-dicarboxylate transport system substrate-binding protein